MKILSATNYSSPNKTKNEEVSFNAFRVKKDSPLANIIGEKRPFLILRNYLRNTRNLKGFQRIFRCLSESGLPDRLDRSKQILVLEQQDFSGLDSSKTTGEIRNIFAELIDSREINPNASELETLIKEYQGLQENISSVESRIFGNLGIQSES